MVNLSDMVVPNRNFQTSINIDFDFGSRDRILGLIPTDTVCRYLEIILRDVLTQSNNRAKLLVGAYGKGKSHVVLAALTAMWIKDPSTFRGIIDAYRESGLGFGDTLEKFIAGDMRLLPVVVAGSTSDLRQSLLFALRTALRKADLEGLMPQTNFDGAQNTLRRWSESYPETLARFSKLTGISYEEALSKLRNLDSATYESFIAAYRELTSGGTFDVLEGSDVLSVFSSVLTGLASNGISGMYIVYDEFSKYLETSIDKATLDDTRLLQDLAEMCNRSSQDQQMHLLLISHKSLSNYIDTNLPKDKVDGWRGVSGRFDEIEMVDDSNQYYQLMASAIVKDPAQWDEWCRRSGGTRLKKIDAITERYHSRGIYDDDAVSLVSRGCYPLHPLTAYLLPQLSEKVAQNERTLFTFICGTGEHTLASVLRGCRTFVTPDAVYDYFEPLLRREFYASPLHRVYELTRAALAHVQCDGLEEKIIKTIAVIDAVSQYDRVAPSRETIAEVFTDCGYESSEIESALTTLIKGESVVYLRRSNAHLKLKETTGVHVEQEVSDKAEALRSSLSCTDILNRRIAGMAFYPSRHNEEKGVVRYFDCGFADEAALRNARESVLGRSGDGEVIAVWCDNADNLHDLKDLAREVSRRKLTVVVFPKVYRRVDDALYRLEAAIQLKSEAENDNMLADEYEIMVEDYAEVVDGFIASCFQPELRQSRFFVGGMGKNSITRKRRLSEELSALCDEVFYQTPRITSESLNKNELTGTAFSSRTKILKALCAPVLAKNLGFVGNGQETSMARSALEMTGLIENIAENVNAPGKPEPGIDAVIDTIDNFVSNASDASFEELYKNLTGRELGIGLRRGPIPLYLAYVLRRYRDEVKITRNGEERALNEELLDDISRQPEAYRLTRLNWSPTMARYIEDLGELFSCPKIPCDRNDVVDAIRTWYVSLPQVTRNSRRDHTVAGGAKETSEKRKAFFKALRPTDTATDVLLFEQIPSIFGEKAGSGELIGALRAEKEGCDRYRQDSIDALAKMLISLFEPHAHNDASLCSVLRDWIEANPAANDHVFSGVNNLVLNAVKNASGDDATTVGRMAKAATSLRVDDWNDSRFDDFIRVVSEMKNEVEGSSETSSDGDTAQTGILFIDNDGVAQKRTFDAVVPGERAKLLKRQIIACLEDMGGSVTPEEKRQVVFDVLKGLC